MGDGDYIEGAVMKKTSNVPYFFMVFFVLLILSHHAHCTTTATKHTNTLGTLQYTENPLQYLEASVVGGDVHNNGKQEFTTVRFQPTGTYVLFTQDFSFCGDEADTFNGKNGVVVVAFSKVQHHRDCFDLYSVHEVKGDK